MLHVEDDGDLCNVVSAALAPLADVVAAPSLAAARRELAVDSFDVAILDVTLEDGSGLDLLTELEAASPPVPTIIFSARDTDRAVASQAEGAMTKSRTSLDALVDAVRSALEGRDPERAEPAGRRAAGGSAGS